MAIKIDGLNQLIKGLNSFNEISQKALDKYTKEVVKDAKRLAPREIIFEDAQRNRTIMPTNVSSQISATTENGEVTINVNNEIAAYIEFGTGEFAANLLSGYPDEWVDIASDFYKNGKGILISSPYLYPAVWINEKTFEDEFYRLISKI